MPHGAGADVFIVDVVLGVANLDNITDFNVVEDSIYLENTDIFTAFETTGLLDSGAFNVGSTAMQADDRIIYNRTNGDLLYDADGTGSGIAIHFATLLPRLMLSHANFVII